MKKSTLKAIIIAAFTTSAFATTACNNQRDLEPPKKPLELDQNTITLSTTETSTLNLNNTQQAVWYSTDPQTATVDQQGLITALQAGNATIWAVNGQDSAKCTVTVNPAVIIATTTMQNQTEIGQIYKNFNQYITIKDEQNPVSLNTVAIQNASIYTAGNTLNNSYVWQNQTPLYTLQQSASIVKVIPHTRNKTTTIYSLGSLNENNIPTAKIWQNQTMLSLNSTLNPSAINDGTIDPLQNLYCVGYTTSAQQIQNATAWNQNEQIILCAEKSQANSVAFDGATPVITGTIGDSAVVWKNQQTDTLQSNKMKAYPTSIAIAGGNTYICGFVTSQSGIQTPVLWTNAEMTKLSNLGGIANQVTAYNGEVYVVGKIYNTNYTNAVLWKNGQQTIISNPQEDASAVAITIR